MKNPFTITVALFSLAIALVVSDQKAVAEQQTEGLTLCRLSKVSASKKIWKIAVGGDFPDTEAFNKQDYAFMIEDLEYEASIYPFPISEITQGVLSGAVDAILVFDKQVKKHSDGSIYGEWVSMKADNHLTCSVVKAVSVCKHSSNIFVPCK